MQLEVNAQSRKAQGTGASRRLRKAGKVPGILYGGTETAVALEIDHNELFQLLRKEAFHASILALTLDGKKHQVLLRHFNMHPFRKEVQHIDFQRVLADQKIHMKVPLHFMNQDQSEAVKFGSAIITHVMNEIDIRCLPADLPEFIEVDLANISVSASIHVQDLKVPKGVELVVHGKENPVVATASVPKVVEEAAATEEATPAASAVPAAKQPEKAAAAEPAKKDEKKK